MNEPSGQTSGEIKNPPWQERFVVHTTRSGKTLIASKPSSEQYRVFTNSHKSVEEEIRSAATYAEFASDVEIYKYTGMLTSRNAYQVAMADYLGKPKILAIDPSQWTGGIGQPIHIKAKDDFCVLFVRLMIRENKKDGLSLEDGVAVQSETDDLLWTYTTTRQVTKKRGLRLYAFAFDLPGNVGGSCLEIK
jgi:hypothetical protein